MRKKTKSKKTKQKQKQKQSQNVRQTVTVNLGNISKRRPQRRTGTRTGPMVTYQQMPIPLAPSVDYGKLEHTINSLQNNILHSINKRENNNLMTTPAVQEPAPRVNLGTQTTPPRTTQPPRIVELPAEFPTFLQAREFRRADEKIASQRTGLEEANDALKQMNIAMTGGGVRQTGIPEVEGIPLKGRPKKDTQIAEPINPQKAFVSQNSTKNLKEVKEEPTIKKQPIITPEPVLKPTTPEKDRKPQLTGEFKATTPLPKKKGRPKGSKNKSKTEKKKD